VVRPTFSDLNNINGTVNLLESAKDSGVKRFVFSSSSSIYGGSTDLPTKESLPPNPKSPYALQKLTGERYCKLFSELYDLDTVSLRYFNVFGPRQRADSAYAAVIAAFCAAEKNKKAPTIYGGGEQFRDFCYVQNVVDANIRASLLREEPLGGAVLNIGCGGRITVNDLCSKICSIDPVYEAERAGDVFCSQADISLAKKYLGYQATHSFDDGIRETMKWHLEFAAV
jgi:UDP-glucose 4-epimerase